MDNETLKAISKSLKYIEEALSSIDKKLSGFLLIIAEKETDTMDFKNQENKFLYLNSLGIEKELIGIRYNISPKTVGEKISRARGEKKKKHTEKNDLKGDK